MDRRYKEVACRNFANVAPTLKKQVCFRIVVLWVLTSRSLSKLRRTCYPADGGSVFLRNGGGHIPNRLHDGLTFQPLAVSLRTDTFNIQKFYMALALR